MKAKYIKNIFTIALAGSLLLSCNDYLDEEPKSYVTPEYYFNSADHLEAYANKLYPEILPGHSNWSYGIYGNDNQTDNQTGRTYDDKYVKGKWKVPQTDGDHWKFNNINDCNYFFEQVLPKYEAEQISGATADIRHYIGEMYFLRAFEYFKRYQSFGDFPIITKPLADDRDALIEASKRSPRNMVARFILDDLDKAIDLMSDKDMATTRINKDAALLFKSRVALYEGSWLKNFNGTAFVPGTNEWPGKDKDYNAGFSFPAGTIEAEYNWFFDQAMAASKEVGDKIVGKLIANTGVVPQTQTTLNDIEAANPYMAMFGKEILSNNPEVLMWRQYNKGLGVVHCVEVSVQRGNYGVGVTRGMVDGFLMSNGLPIYASSGYQGDENIANVRKDRDPRLNVFLKEPGQKNLLISGTGDTSVPDEPVPNILSNADATMYTTGYALRKGGSFDQNQANNGQCYQAAIIFRGVEALLNYMEASYERNGNVDATAASYWEAIRARHTGMDTDYSKTIAATNMQEEAKNDWGAYTAGELVNTTLYNIRRERRCELMAEGFRWMDLCRWRAMDQMITTPYHIEGIHIWNTEMESWYDAENLKKTISSSSRSEYLRPYETDAQGEVYNGFTWSMAHYLRPIMYKQFLLTAADSTTPSTATIYQNPYWPTAPDKPAEK